MGNARTKARGDILNEYDEAYFESLAEKFNTTATSSSTTNSKSNKLFGCFSITKRIKEGNLDVTTIPNQTTITTNEPTNKTPSKTHDKIEIAIVTESSHQPHSPLSSMYVLPAPGPLQTHTTLKIPTPNKKSKKRRKRRQTTIGIKHSYQHPSTEQAPCSTAYYIHEKGTPLDMDADDSSPFSPSETIDINHIPLTVDHDSHNMLADSNKFEDSSSFKDLIDICESEQHNSSPSKDHEMLDASFNSGILWDSLTLNSTILVCKFSPSCNSWQPLDSSSLKSSLYVAMGCENGTIIISEIQDEVHRSSPEKKINSKSNSPQRSTLGSSRKIHIIAKLQQDSRIRTLDFSPCGRFLLAAGDDCLVCIYFISSDPNNLSCADGGLYGNTTVSKLAETEREDRIYSTAWAPSSKNLFAVGGFDGKLAIYSFIYKHSMAHLLLEIPCNCLILSVSWSPDTSALAIGGSNKVVTIFEVEEDRKDESDEQSVESIRLTKISEIPRVSTISCLQWRFDGSYLAIAAQDGSVVLFSIASDTQRLKEIYRAKIDDTLTGTRAIHTICFSPDGLFLALSYDSKCFLLEMESYTVVQEIKRINIVKSIDWVYWPFSLDSGPSKCILAVTEDSTLCLLKTGTDDDGSTQYSFDSSDYDSTDGSSISSANSTKSTDWSFDETSFIETVPDAEMKKSVAGDTEDISFVSFSTADLRTKKSCFLAVAYLDGTVRIVSTDNWMVIKSLSLPEPLTNLLWSYDSEFLVTHMTSEISLVSTQTWDKVHELTRSSETTSCCWNPASNILLIGSSDGLVRILGKQEDDFIIRGEIDGKDSSVNCLNWSHDDKYIAICREDASVTVYNSIDICENFFLAQSETLSCILAYPARFLQFTSDSDIFSKSLHLALFTKHMKLSFLTPRQPVVATRTISMYSVADKGVPLREFECTSSLICFSLSSRDCLATGVTGTKGSNIISVYNVFNDEKPVEVESASDQSDTVTSVSFNAHGDLMAASAKDGVITIYDCETWSAMLCLPNLNLAIDS